MAGLADIFKNIQNIQPTQQSNQKPRADLSGGGGFQGWLNSGMPIQQRPQQQRQPQFSNELMAILRQLFGNK